MRKIWMLSLANIRKTKSHTGSLFLLFGITTLLLSLGLLVLLNFSSYFDKLAKELNTTNTYYLMTEHLYSNEVESYFESSENILEWEKEETLYLEAEMPYNTNSRESFSVLLKDADAVRNLSRWKFVGEHLPAEGEMSIYLPVMYQLVGGYELNDTISMKLADRTLEFTVKGFTEDVLFSSTDTVMMGCYLPHAAYERLWEELESGRFVLVFANQTQVGKDTESEIREINHGEAIGGDAANLFYGLLLDDIKLSRTMMANIISAMTVAFAAIITGVCLIVVRFRIGNSIEEDMTKIGSLKAVGYTSRQIVCSIVLQFSIIAIAGSILGIGLSYASVPALSHVFSIQSGLIWTQSFDGGISFAALAAIALVVAGTALLSARSIYRLSPIISLRGGITTHSFRRNPLPLEKSRGNLPLRLSLKSILQNGRQSLMVALILMVIAFTGSFAVLMFYNTVIDTSTFAETPGFELSDVVAYISPAEDPDQFLQELQTKEEVRKAQYLDSTVLGVEQSEDYVSVMVDYSAKETNNVYEGRYPIHANEVTVPGSMARQLDKKIGDVIRLSYGDASEEYLITGLTQGASINVRLFITLEGVCRLRPDFRQQGLQIYLREDVDTGQFIEKIQDEYGTRLLTVVNEEKEIEQGMGAYVSIVAMVGIAVMAASVLVVVLVLYFVINSTVIRRRRELGIQKAIGFTTWQLMRQMSVSFMIPIGFGVVAGCLQGAFLTNAIMSLAQRSMGVMKANYIVDPLWIIGCGILILLLSYGTSMLITWRIRKISAYALVTE